MINFNLNQPNIIMRLIYLFLSLIFLLAQNYTVAQGETDQAYKEAVTKLGFLVGDWAGEGWMMGRDGQKHPFAQTEKVRFKLDSTVVLIEGLGKDGESVIHNALAVVSLDKENGNYSFRSYLANGHSNSFRAELVEDDFYWYPGDNMRYIISINEQGQWFEKGEMKGENGWFQFFEMTLDKKK